ncbi:MAG TPA: hypothetical protein VIK69_02945, partial [Methylophilaceae bacterium]
MALRIAKEKVSEKAWGSVDKSAIWQRLKRALQEDESGAKEAVREMYAAVKADVGPDLTEVDCWGPHHELKGDTLVLNRNGLVAAAQALAGARAKPNLTPEQRREAARHLLRHYRELKMEPPESLRQLAGEEAQGEMMHLAARVSGEMRVEDVPLAPWAQKAVEQLKAGDDDPLEVVVEVPAGKSKRGWNYTPQALQRIVEAVNRDGLPGILGHQRPEDVDHQFPVPVTHWVGALWKDGKAYFRGVVDKAASDLKRWVRAGVIRQVSIFGRPKLANVAGEVHVVDYQPLSIDWTPLNRAGMPTRVVAIGEMDSTFVDTDYLDVGAEPAPAGEQSGGDQAVTLQEALAVVREHLASRNATIAGVCGEMGWSFEDIAKELGGEAYQNLQARANAVGEMAEILGLDRGAAPADVVAA